MATVQPDGSLTTAAQEQITGGTDRYSGATGRIDETCAFPAGDNTGICTRNVVIKY